VVLGALSVVFPRVRRVTLGLLSQPSEVKRNTLQHELVGNLQSLFPQTNRNRFSFVFPNTAFVVATFQLGLSFDSKPIKIFGSVLAAVLFIVWILVCYAMVQAVVRRQALWPSSNVATLLHRGETSTN
jgi:hypothetical protein